MHNVQHAHIYQLVYVHFTPPGKCQGFWAFCNITVTLAFIPLSTALHFSPICEHIGLDIFHDRQTKKQTANRQSVFDENI